MNWLTLRPNAESILWGMELARYRVQIFDISLEGTTQKVVILLYLSNI
jgi:hypothetical protein